MEDKNLFKSTFKKVRITADRTLMSLLPSKKSPDEMFGDLFAAVQMSRVHEDGKTFVDQVPNARMREIVKAYKKESKAEDFDLREFVGTHFHSYLAAIDESVSLKATDDPEEHIKALWNKLTKSAPQAIGSLIPLPHPYVVPGGRFQEQFYWDSYFIMLGLEASDRSDLTDNMMANFAHLFRKFGFIPTGNRTYFTTRSQPPYYLQMIRLVAHRKGHHRYLLPRLPYLLQEYQFWTKETPAFMTMSKRSYHRNVRMPDATTLQRYYDARETPRPESYREDIETADHSDKDPRSIYRDLRAAAESGWDFSSRWFARKNDITTIETTAIVPLDLNCMLYELELGLAEAYRKLLQFPLSIYYRRKAERRRATINYYLWDEELGFYFDYDFKTARPMKRWTLAALYPLFCGVATHEHAAKVAAQVEELFLASGGVMTTLDNTGEQWDAPNGWAPLEWITIVGLRRYGFHDLADTIKFRWLGTNLALFQSEHKFVEKYNVVEPTEAGGGGEYALQDGFGWTNGVFMALRHDFDIKLAKEIKKSD